MKKGLLLSTVAGALLLIGCSATMEECDPSKELGLFGKMACINSGSYQHRIDQKNSELSSELNTNYQLHTARQQVQQEQKDVSKTVANKQAQLSNLSKSVKKDQATLKTKQQTVASLNRVVTQTKQQILKVQKNPSLSETDKNAELKRLRAILSQREAEAAAAAGF